MSYVDLKPSVSTNRIRSSPRPVIEVAYTPDSDDVLNFYAWENGRVKARGIEPHFYRDTIANLNRSCLQERFDVVAVSSAFYPQVADEYWILACGSSVGRSYGPVLVAREPLTPADLRGKTIACGGIVTTGSALAAMYCPGANLIQMRFDEIGDAVLAGEVDAGVMIHEELLHFPRVGLHRVCCLGKAWCDETGGPLPVGLNIVHKRVGRVMAEQIDTACRESLQWSLDHLDEALAYASQFGKGCSPQFVSMFSNSDTLDMPADVEAALPRLFDRVHQLGLGPKVKKVEVLRGH